MQFGSVYRFEPENFVQILPEYDHLDVQSTSRIIKKIFGKAALLVLPADLENAEVVTNVPEFLGPHADSSPNKRFDLDNRRSD